MRKPKTPPIEIRPGCQHCHHWREQTGTHDEVRWGECWRFPPQMVLTPDQDGELAPMPFVPNTEPEDLCGEFKAGDA